MFICSLLSSHSNERSSMLLPLLLLVYFMYYILSTVCMYVEIPVCFLYCFGWGCRTNLCIVPWSLSGDLWTSTGIIEKQKRAAGLLCKSRLLLYDTSMQLFHGLKTEDKLLLLCYLYALRTAPARIICNTRNSPIASHVDLVYLSLRQP